MKKVEQLKVKIFADGAEKAGMLEMAGKSWIQGLTTNPTLMRKAGISDYKAFAKEILGLIREKPISFEVFSDEFSEMERQAMEIARARPGTPVKLTWTREQDFRHDRFRPAHVARSRVGVDRAGRIAALHTRITGISMWRYQNRPPMPGVATRSTATPPAWMTSSRSRCICRNSAPPWSG